MINRKILNQKKFFSIIFSLFFLFFLFSCDFSQSKKKFNGDRAFTDLAYQVSLGPRFPGSKGYYQTIDWITDLLIGESWQVEIQQSSSNNLINNIIAKKGEGEEWVIIGAHFDTRKYADQDPDPNNRTETVPGANDGASGVAVLLELSRIIPNNLRKEIWLVFFDAEDNGGIDNSDWALGSRYFVESLHDKPDAVVIIDMVGDEDLDIYFERSSNPDLAGEIWDMAKALGHDEFIKQPKYHLIDDHTPFLLNGITAIDIIDFDYPYWHSIEDTIDKVSPQSLQIAGETVFMWLLKE